MSLQKRGVRASAPGAGVGPHPGAPWPSGAGGRCVCISPEATLSDLQDGGELKSMERLDSLAEVRIFVF